MKADRPAPFGEVSTNAAEINYIFNATRLNGFSIVFTDLDNISFEDQERRS